MIADAAEHVAAALEPLTVPTHPTPVPSGPATGPFVVVGSPSLTADLGDVTGCGYVQADVTVTAVAGGLDPADIIELYRLVDTTVALLPPNDIVVTAVTATVWGPTDQPSRPAYSIDTRTTLTV